MTSPHQAAAEVVAELRARLGMLGPQPEQMLRFMNGMAPLLEKSANLIEQQAIALSEAEAERDDVRLQFAASMQEFDIRNVELAAAEARLAEAVKVIGFYADQRRYDGPNLRPIPGDPFAKPDAVYIHDVTRDHGEIARSFLNSASNKEPR